MSREFPEHEAEFVMSTDSEPPPWPLVVTWLRPKKGKREFPISPEMWPRIRAVFRLSERRALHKKSCTLTVMKEPKDLASAIDMAEALTSQGSGDTAADRQKFFDQTIERGDKRSDNRNRGGWQYGRD